MIKKVTKLIPFMIIPIVLLVICILLVDKKTNNNMDNIKLSINIDGVKVTSIPNTNYYDLDSYCIDCAILDGIRTSK